MYSTETATGMHNGNGVVIYSFYDSRWLKSDSTVHTFYAFHSSYQKTDSSFKVKLVIGDHVAALGLITIAATSRPYELENALIIAKNVLEPSTSRGYAVHVNML